jgi:4-hydroxy-3-methylbut-2-en-1-yl diphosphate synthase IspG/GcpE
VYESKEEYDAEIPAIAEVLSPLVVKCRDLGRAMRIGTNHGEQYAACASLACCGSAYLALLALRSALSLCLAKRQAADAL